MTSQIDEDSHEISRISAHWHVLQYAALLADGEFVVLYKFQFDYENTTIKSDFRDHHKAITDEEADDVKCGLKKVRRDDL